jgi:hypothetical protein
MKQTFKKGGYKLLGIKFPVDSEYRTMNGIYVGGKSRDQFEGTDTHFTWRGFIMLLKIFDEGWPSIRDSNLVSIKFR